MSFWWRAYLRAAIAFGTGVWVVQQGMPWEVGVIVSLLVVAALVLLGIPKRPPGEVG